MRSRLLTILALIVGVAVFTTACGSTTSPSSLTAITVSGTAPTVGTTTQLVATGTLSDGTTQDVTTSATWVSSDPSVATVSTAGAVTGVAAGPASVFATMGNVTGALQVTVN